MANTYKLFIIFIFGFLYFFGILMHKYGIVFGMKQTSNNAMKHTGAGAHRMNKTMTHNMERRLPTAVIIGGMKCGTGALQMFLSLHPDAVTTYLYETKFFGLSYNKGIEWYRAQIHPSHAHQITFTKSIYFPSRFDAPRNIYTTDRNMKLIMILRNPVERTISHFTMKQHQYRAKCPMLRKCVISNRNGEVLANHTLIHFSMYFKNFLKWLVYFPLKQFLVLDGDLFAKNPLPAMKEVERFLGLRDYFNGSILYYEKTKGFYCYRTEKSNKTKCLPKRKGRKHPPVPSDLKKRLSKFFKPYNEMLFALINKRMDWT